MCIQSAAPGFCLTGHQRLRPALLPARTAVLPRAHTNKILAPCRPLCPGDEDELQRLHAALFPINYEMVFFQKAVRGHDNIFSWAALQTCAICRGTDCGPQPAGWHSPLLPSQSSCCVGHHDRANSGGDSLPCTWCKQRRRRAGAWHDGLHHGARGAAG